MDPINVKIFSTSATTREPSNIEHNIIRIMAALVHAWQHEMTRVYYYDLALMPEHPEDRFPLRLVQFRKELTAVRTPVGITWSRLLHETTLFDLRNLYPGVADADLLKAVANGGKGGHQAHANLVNRVMSLRSHDYRENFDRRASCLGNLFH